MIGWIPFLEPCNALQEWWYLLLIPMAFGISVVYRAVRAVNYIHYWRSVCIMAGQIIIGIGALAFAIGFFVQVIIPLLN